MRVLVAVVLLASVACGGGGGGPAAATTAPEPVAEPEPVTEETPPPAPVVDPCVATCDVTEQESCSSGDMAQFAGSVACNHDTIHGSCLARCKQPSPAAWTSVLECIGYCGQYWDLEDAVCSEVNMQAMIAMQLQEGTTPELEAACTSAAGR